MKHKRHNIVCTHYSPSRRPTQEGSAVTWSPTRDKSPLVAASKMSGLPLMREAAAACKIPYSEPLNFFRACTVAQLEDNADADDTFCLLAQKGSNSTFKSTSSLVALVMWFKVMHRGCSSCPSLPLSPSDERWATLCNSWAAQKNSTTRCSATAERGTATL